jgi:hypothetical protein
MKQAIQAHFEGLPNIINFVIIIPIEHMVKVKETLSPDEIQTQINEYWRVESAPTIASLNFGWMSDGGIAMNVIMKRTGPIVSWPFTQYKTLLQKMVNVYATHMEKDMRVYLDRKTLAKGFNPTVLFDSEDIIFPSHINKSTLSLTIDRNYVTLNAKAW